MRGNMRKVFLAAFLLGLLLNGCQRQTGGNLPEETTLSETGQVKPEETQTEAQKRGETTIDFGQTPGGFIGRYTISDNGFLKLGVSDGMMQYLDFTSGQEIYLCNKEGCAHADQTCNANVLDLSAIAAFFYDGRLYLLCPDGEMGKLCMWTSDPDGSNRKKIISGMVGTEISGIALNGNKLYYTSTAYQEDTDTNTSENIQQMKRYGVLVVCDLQKEKAEILDSYQDSAEAGIGQIYQDGDRIYYRAQTYSESPSLLWEEYSQNGEDMEAYMERVQSIRRTDRYMYVDTSTSTDTPQVYMEEVHSNSETVGFYGAYQGKGLLLSQQGKGLYWKSEKEEKEFLSDVDDAQILMTDAGIITIEQTTMQICVYDRDTDALLGQTDVPEEDRNLSVQAAVNGKLYLIAFNEGDQDLMLSNLSCVEIEQLKQGVWKRVPLCGA